MAGPVRESRVTAADRRHFDFMETLLRISNELTEEETADVKIFCMHLIPRGHLAQLRRAMDVFIKLLDLNKIDQENLEFIEEILERIGRQDLIRDILRRFRPPDREIPENPELQPENPEIQPENPESQPENPEIQPENPESQPENPESQPENPEPQPGTSREGANTEGNETSNIYTVVEGQVRMIQETLDRLKNRLATLCGIRRSQVKFRGYKKHKSILVHFSIPRENTAVLRHMADHSDPRLVYMGVKSLQIDAEVPIKVQQGALFYDVKRQLPVDDIEVGCSTRRKHQRAPVSWTRLSALNLFSDALPLHLQAAASLECQGFSYSLVRALAQKDQLREHQMRRAIQNLRNAEVDSNTLRQKAEVDSNTIMTLRSKLNITENMLKEANLKIAVLEENLQLAQEYAEKAAKQVASHVTEYRGEKPPGGWRQEYRGEKPRGGWSAHVEKADAATQTLLADTDGTTGIPEDAGNKLGEEPPSKEKHKNTERQDSDSGGERTEHSLGTEAAEQERHTAGAEGAASRSTGDLGQDVITFGGKGLEPGKFSWPRGVLVSPRNEIFVADKSNRRVQVHSMKGVYLRQFPTIVPGTEGKDMEPHDICMDANGTLWVVGRGDKAEHVVQYSTDGTALTQFGLPKNSYFRGVAVDMRTNHILVTGDADRGKVQVFRPDGSLVRTVRHPRGEMKHPQYVTVDGEGNILVLDCFSHSVYVYDEYGKFLLKFGGWGSGEDQLRYPNGICTDSSGHIIVADSGNERVQIFTRHGEFVRSVRTQPGSDGIFGLAVGPEGQLVVTKWNHTVTVFPSY
ncbi:tripartite motif-containing protein 3-like [Branchiostoma lanceolatum]|uniref:tripartite motif-containing protein 3-like n=1 Tax=Branchiostoma lanceolatum TaxID=7740 RepID=UPI003454836C